MSIYRKIICKRCFDEGVIPDHSGYVGQVRSCPECMGGSRATFVRK